MGGAKDDDAEVHPEVEHLEELRLGEGQHDHPDQLRQRDPAQHLQRRETANRSTTSHTGGRLLCGLIKRVICVCVYV